MTSPTTHFVATGDVAAGGSGVVRAHGAALAFDGTAGRLDDVPGPADLLCAALAACLLKNVERFAHLLPFRYASAAVRVEAERAEAPPRIVRLRYELRVVTAEPAPRVDLLHRNIAKFGTIANTLRAGCEITGVVIADPPPADA